MDRWQHALGTFGGFDPYADILARAGRGPDRATLQPTIRARHFERCTAMPLMPGVADVLADARAAGKKTAVASSSAEDWVGPFLRQHGLDAQSSKCRSRIVGCSVARLGPFPVRARMSA